MEWNGMEWNGMGISCALLAIYSADIHSIVSRVIGACPHALYIYIIAQIGADMPSMIYPGFHILI